MSTALAIRGGGGGGKGGSVAARVPVESPDTLRSTAFARVLDLLCEGEIEGLVNGLKSVFLDGTQIENDDGTLNFNGVSIVTVNGTQGQTYLPGFTATESEHAVDVEVTASVSVTRTITNPDTNSVRVRILIPGLSKQNVTTGDLTGTTVVLAIDVQANGGGFVAQNIGFHWVNSPMPAVQLAIALAITVKWTPSGAAKHGQTYVAYGYVKFSVEYRVVGAGGWTVYKADNLVTTIPVGRGRGPSPGFSRTYTVPSLLSALYEARVVKTAGDGTVSVSLFRVLTAANTDTITGKATSPYQRSYLIKLTGTPPWDIRVRRLTPDSASVTLQNTTHFGSYTEITDAKFSYPNSALIGLSIDASQFSAIPVRGYEVKLLRVKIPSNYDPVTRVYTGIWDGTFVVDWTDNPAWCFYDLIANTRYGLGNFIAESQLDKWALYAIGVYCDGLVPDGLGGEEPRLTCNVYFQTQAEAFQVVALMASIFRGMVYWSAGLVTAVQDAPLDPVFLFTEANVADGLFTYSGSAKGARHTTVLVAWNDPADGYKTKPEYVEDIAGIARYGVVQTSITALGATSRGQANRMGKWLLYSERLETEVCTFRCGLDGTYLRPGSTFSVQDQHRAGIRHGGRIQSATAGSVTLDASVTIAAGQAYTIQVALPDGTLATKIVTNSPGAYTVLTISVTFAMLPSPNAVWLLTSTNVSAQLFRALSITEVERQVYEVVGLEHNESKFDAVELGLQLITPLTSILTVVPASPQNLVVSEYYSLRKGLVMVTIRIAWEPVANAVRYQVAYRRDDGNFTRLTEVAAQSAEIVDAVVGVYEVRVAAINSLGVLSAEASGTIRVILGKTLPPSSIDFYVDAALVGGNLILSWLPVADEDFDHYEVRFGPLWVLGVTVGVTKEPRLLLAAWLNGLYDVKAFNTSGAESTQFAQAVVSFPHTFNLVDGTIFDEAINKWPGTFNQTTRISNLPFDSGTLPLGLTLEGQTKWDDLSLAWSTYTGVWDFYYDPYLSGTYETLALVFNQISTAHLVGNISSGHQGPIDPLSPFGNTTSNLWSQYIEPWVFYNDIYTKAKDAVTVTVQIATNQTTGPGGWTAFAPWAVGAIYTARMVKFLLTLTTTTKAYRPILLDFQFLGDGHARRLLFQNQAIDSGGTVIMFEESFITIDTIHGTLIDAAIGDTFTVTSKSATGMTVTIYNSAGATKAGTIDLTVDGWGALVP